MGLENIVVLIIVVILIIVLLKFLFGILAILPASGIQIYPPIAQNQKTLKACPAIICSTNHTRLLVHSGNYTPGSCQPGICP